MNPKIYRQQDPRWASQPYKNKPYTVATDGCGLCAVTHCAIELDKYKNSTPRTFYSFMKQYATNGDGTEWVGIDKGLENYLGNSKRHYNMTSFFDELNKGGRVGVILFGKGTAPDGTVWTGGGHYVAFVQYKVEGGLHYLYTKDSNGNKCLDGWHSYEKSMKGCIPDVMWTAYLSGWVKDPDGWHYYQNGEKLKNNWAQDSIGWCYLDKSGNITKSEWIKWKDDWYYLKPDGYMKTNDWQKDSTGWCYLGKDGKQVKGAWIRWKNNMYYIKGDGYMQTGSANIPCSFDADGKLEASI